MTTYPSGSALLVVDVQNDFADPSGSLYVEGGEDVVPLLNEQIERAQAAGAPVVLSQDWHPPDTPHFEKDGGLWPVHCVADTWGAAFHPGLEVPPGAPVIRKGSDGGDGYSAFSVRDPLSGSVTATELGDLLLSDEVRRLVIGGLATDYCVVETVVDARLLGLSVEVLREAIRAVDLSPGDGDRAMTRMRDAGAEFS